KAAFMTRYVRAVSDAVRGGPGPTGARAEFALAAFTRCWLEPRRRVVTSLEHTIRWLQELGDVEYMAYALRFRVHLLALMGEPLETVESESERARGLLQSQEKTVMFSTRAYELLRSGSPAPIDWQQELGPVESLLAHSNRQWEFERRFHLFAALC